MKRDEPFNASIKSMAHPIGLSFQKATTTHINSITALMIERNPTLDPDILLDKTILELAGAESDPNYKLYVAELNGEVLGFCRFWHSSALSSAKKIYPAPEGWYAMGIMVHPSLRRKGIARFLTLNRIEILKEMGVQELYSLVDAKNLTSLRMHREFGFIEESTAPGFLHIKFETGAGSLLKLSL